MAANTQPIFTLTPQNGLARLAAANAARDGSGAVTVAYTAGTNGAFVKKVTFTSAQASAAASSAMVARVFISTDGGTTWRLRSEVAIPTVTASNTAIGATQVISYPDGLVLPASAKIGVTISVYAGVQDQMDVVVESGDY